MQPMLKGKITKRLHKVGTSWTPYFTMSWFRLRRAEERNNMLGYIIRQLFFSEGLYTFFLWGFFIFFSYFFIYFFYVYFLYFFWLGGGSFMSHPFYVLFGAISRLAWKPPLRRVSQPKRINWWGFLPPLLWAFFQPTPQSCTRLSPSYDYLFPSCQLCWG